MLKLILNIQFAADVCAGNIQIEMDARYLEKPWLTNLFTKFKF